ncbi:MAG: helix-turn-helix transcriptional regulator [Treponema sp.]|nr:helix-turn-helix transcriptional regulator [Treponema sp.]
MNSIRETFVNNLKYYRNQKGISQEKLSYAVEKSIAYINQIENRDSWPQPEMVDKIAVVLGVPSSALFEERGCPENKNAQFEDKFGKTLEEELLSRIEKDVRDVCKLI